MMITALERTEGHYEVQDVEFGKVYRWSPGHVNIECECGERLNFTAVYAATCPRCGADHTATIREELTAERTSKNETLHPWRYEAQSLEDTGLPC
jgi:hypothetical protein